MDKEIKAKVDELMKNLATRELSLDEMDKVSGGAGECFQATRIKTEDDLVYYVYTFLGSMEKAYGKDVVSSYIKQDFPSYNVLKDYESYGLDGLYNTLGRIFVDKEFAHR